LIETNHIFWFNVANPASLHPHSIRVLVHITFAKNQSGSAGRA
jgi:hypothetical protein